MLSTLPTCNDQSRLLCLPTLALGTNFFSCELYAILLHLCFLLVEETDVVATSVGKATVVDDRHHFASLVVERGAGDVTEIFVDATAETTTDLVDVRTLVEDSDRSVTVDCEVFHTSTVHRFSVKVHLQR